MKHKVLVVGANGFLGSNLISSTRREIDFLSVPQGGWPDPRLHSDIRTVVFLRAISSPTYVHQFPAESHLLNVTKSKGFIQRCIESNKRVIFSSSDVIYGDTGNEIVDEASRLNPYGVYAKQKSEIEAMFSDSLDFISLRLSLMVGTGSKLRKILANEPQPTIPDPVIRHPINVKHVVNLIEELVLTKTWTQELKVLNVGGSEQLSIYDLAEMESVKFGLRHPVRITRDAVDVAARPQTVRMYSKLAEDFSGNTFGVD
jgi:nucleoside-diphosphate-sugar epimerase